MKNEIFDGKVCYFIDEMHGMNEPVVLGTCNADDHWKALEKFERGLGMSRTMERGRCYRIRTGAQSVSSMKFKIKFVY